MENPLHSFANSVKVAGENLPQIDQPPNPAAHHPLTVVAGGGEVEPALREVQVDHILAVVGIEGREVALGQGIGASTVLDRVGPGGGTLGGGEEGLEGW